MSVWNYFIDEYQQIVTLLIEHIQLTVIAVGFAILIGIPVGIFISYIAKASRPVLMIANIVQAIPSMALLGFLIPILGIGSIPAIVVVVLYSLLPIIKNTYIGIGSINPQMLEAARGIGLTKSQILFRIQIPLALSVIMAGVRVAAVTAVGLMTMAAFIGAGGLGYLVFSGIRTMNNSQILAGAIPACFLALFVDYVLGYIEEKVTPINLKRRKNRDTKLKRTLEKLGNILLVIFCIFLFSTIGFGNGKTGEKEIVIGSKDYTEQAILGNLLAEYIENQTDIKVIRKLELGGTQVCFGAMEQGEIDLYVEYSGSAYCDILKHTPSSNVEKVYETAKKQLEDIYNIKVLEPLSFNNTFTLAVRPDTAMKYNLHTISDLSKVADQLIAGVTFEFSNREDGLSGLQEWYHFGLKEVVTLDSAPRYQALSQKKVDVIDAFSTDGTIEKLKLKTLADDKQFFPPYYAIPVVRAEVLEQNPELEELLKDIGKLLTEDRMRKLNYQVDEEHRTPEEVAHEFLVKHKLLK